MNNALLALFLGSSEIDMYMQQARALKKEKHIHPDEVKHLIKKLGGALGRVHHGDRKRKIPRSSYTALEVEACLNSLRSMLLALEILNRPQEHVEMPAALQEQAWYKLCHAISQL